MSGVRSLSGRLLALARPRDPETLPVHFDHRRIYVVPTRFGLFFAAVLAAMLLGALNYNNNPALLMALMLGSASMASLVSAQLQISGIDIFAVDAEPVPAGQPLRLRLHARTQSRRLRSALRVSIGEATTQSALRFSSEAGIAEVELSTRRRGWIDVPRIRVATTWPLGLATAFSYVWPDRPLLVYPLPERDAPPLPSGSGDPASRRLHAAGDDVHHLRNYRAGDAPRRIAWKPSARRDTLLVREYEEPTGTDIALDWDATGAPGHESRISRLARWVDDAERDGRRYVLRLPAQPAIGPERGPAHRHACLRALALMADG